MSKSTAYAPMTVLFEGIDGSGKSTLQRAVGTALQEMEVDVELQAFPSHQSSVGKLIRQAFTGAVTIDPRAMLHLMIADAIDMEGTVLKWRGEKKVVLLDRHVFGSSLVYQQEEHALASVLNIGCLERLVAPDLMIVLDVPPDVAKQRMEERGGPKNALFEKDDGDYVARLRSRYKGLAYMQPYIPTLLFDGRKSTEDLALMVLKEMRDASEVIRRAEAAR